MERCIITNREMADEAVTITAEGPMGSDLWGETPITFNRFGQAIIPPHLIPIAEAVWQRPVEQD